MLPAMLSKEEVLRIAKLARLSLTEEEVVQYQSRLGKVLDHVKDLSDVKTSEEMVKHVPKDAVSLREDVARVFPDTKAILQNSPAVEADSFLLPPILEND